MATRDKLDELAMPAPESPEQDPMMDIEDEMAVDDEDEEQMESPLMDISDEELMDELESRGFDVSALSADEEMDAEMDADFDEMDEAELEEL